jgi:hypothetical protein
MVFDETTLAPHVATLVHDSATLVPNLLHRDQSRFIEHQSCFSVLNVAKLLLVILKLTTVVLKLPIAVAELLPLL